MVAVAAVEAVTIGAVVAVAPEAAVEAVVVVAAAGVVNAHIELLLHLVLIISLLVASK